MPAFMAEAGLKTISRQEAAVRLARQVARRILSEGLDPAVHTRDFELLYIESGYADSLQEVDRSMMKSISPNLVAERSPNSENAHEVRWFIFWRQASQMPTLI